MELGISSYSFHRLGKGPEGHGAIPPVEAMIDRTAALGLTGFESYDIEGLSAAMTPRATLTVKATASDGSVKTFSVRCRIDTPEELQYYTHGGILPYVLRSLEIGRAHV